MGQITIFTRDGCPNCQAVRLDLKLCHLPYEEIVMDPAEIQRAPLIYFDNRPVDGGVNELLDMLQDWEVVEGRDGKPTLEPMKQQQQQQQHQIRYHHQNEQHEPQQQNLHHHPQHYQQQQQQQQQHRHGEPRMDPYQNHPANDYHHDDHHSRYQDQRHQHRQQDPYFSHQQGRQHHYPENHSRNSAYPPSPNQNNYDRRGRGGGGGGGGGGGHQNRQQGDYDGYNSYRDENTYSDHNHHHRHHHDPYNNDPYYDNTRTHGNNEGHYPRDINNNHHQPYHYNDPYSGQSLPRRKNIEDPYYDNSHGGGRDPYHHHGGPSSPQKGGRSFHNDDYAYGNRDIYSGRDPQRIRSDDPYGKEDPYYERDRGYNRNRNRNNNRQHDDPYNSGLPAPPLHQSNSNDHHHQYGSSPAPPVQRSGGSSREQEDPYDNNNNRDILNRRCNSHDSYYHESSSSQRNLRDIEKQQQQQQQQKSRSYDSYYYDSSHQRNNSNIDVDPSYESSPPQQHYHHLQKQQQPYRNNNSDQYSQRDAHRDPYNLHYNRNSNNTIDDSLTSHSNMGDTNNNNNNNNNSNREDSYLGGGGVEDSFRSEDDSYRGGLNSNNNYYDDPHGLGSRNNNIIGKNNQEQQQKQATSSPNNNNNNNNRNNRGPDDARTMEAIQNRFHFRENRSTSLRDLYNHQRPSARDLSFRRQSSVDGSVSSISVSSSITNSIASNVESGKQSPVASTSPASNNGGLSRQNSLRSSNNNGVERRHVLKTDKYQDDENPFVRNSLTKATTTTTTATKPTSAVKTSTPNNHALSSSPPLSRRDMFRKTTSYERHSFHGKTLLERHRSEDDESSQEDIEPPAPSAHHTSPKKKAGANSRRFGNRREMFGKKNSYDRHSFHGKTLLQQSRETNNNNNNNNHEKCQQRKDSQHGSEHELERGSNSGKGSSRHGTSRVSNSVKEGDAGGFGESNAGSSSNSRRSFHVDLDKDSLAESSGDFSGDDGEDDGTKDYSFCSEKELEAALSRISGSSKAPRRDSKESLSAEDLYISDEGSECSVRSSISARSSSLSRSSERRSGNEAPSRIERFSRSFSNSRQSSSKSLTSRLSAGKSLTSNLSAGRASSMRHLYSNDETTSSALDSLVTGRRGNLKSSRSMSPKPSGPRRPPTSGMGSGLKAARSAALMKSSLKKSMSSGLNDSHSSASSMWSNSPGPAVKDDKTMVELPFGNRMPILQAVRELKRIIRFGNLKYNLTTYRNSFTGSSLCDTFQERYRLSRRDAEDLGKSLGQAQVLTHVASDHGFADTEKLFFRLQCHQTPEILNSFCVWQDENSLTKNATEVMDEVMGRLLVVMDKITDSAKGRVHYSQATKQHEDMVAELDYAICELQMLKLARMDKNALLAVGLNIFQLMLHYAFIKVGIPSTTSGFNSFWTNLKFNVGGDIYSFADWWNGICRGNRKGPHGPKPFQGKDPRCFLNLPDPVDPRIHFAAGMTHFLRPLVVYSVDNIQGELEHVARIYCKNVEFVWMEISTNTLTLSPNLKIYQTDFCSAIKNFPKKIMPWLPGKEKAHVDEMLTVNKKIKVEFHDNVQNVGWSEYAGEHFMYQTAPRADYKKIITSKKTASPERREVKRQGSLKSLFRLEGAAAS